MSRHALRDWLLAQGVHSVAMEAAGIYRLPLYGVREAAKQEVRMVNGRQTRNLPGRKIDMADCQWGATLHMHGLLRAGFVPPADIRRLQDYLRLRAAWASYAAAYAAPAAPLPRYCPSTDEAQPNRRRAW